MARGVSKEAIRAVAERSEELMAESIRRQIAEHVPEAVETLGQLARGECVGDMEKIQGTVVRQAARDILEIAGGRPETRDPRTNDPSHQVHIYVQRFAPGTEPSFEKVAGPAIHAVLEDLASQARGDEPLEPELASSSVAREYDLPDIEYKVLREEDDAEAEVAGTD